MKLILNNDDITIRFNKTYNMYNDIIDDNSSLNIIKSKIINEKQYVLNQLKEYLIRNKINKLLKFQDNPKMIYKWKSKINYHIHLNKCINNILILFNYEWDKIYNEYFYL